MPSGRPRGGEEEPVERVSAPRRRPTRAAAGHALAGAVSKCQTACQNVHSSMCTPGPHSNTAPMTQGIQSSHTTATGAATSPPG